MLLAIDIGNTQVTIGVYRNDKLLASWRVSSGEEQTADERWVTIKTLFQDADLDLNGISGCAISSVVPNQTPKFIEIVHRKMGISPIVVNSGLVTGLKILYDDPSSVGADRICNSIAALKKFGGPLIIVDAGTATTFDIVSEKNEYLGGVIAPGIESSSNVLHRYAARLPKVELTFPESIIGKTTEASMQAGIMFGSVDMINGIVRRILNELDCPAKVIATGGIARQVLQCMDYSPAYEPNLTLDGLRLIYNLNK